MNEWLLAAAISLPALGACLWVCARREMMHALVGLELASTLTAAALILLSEGTHRQPFVDLALIFALLALIGSIAFVRLLEDEL